MLDANKVKIMLEQYIRCCEDIRHLDNGLWQISSINITIAGVMIGLSFQYLSGYYRLIPLSLAFVLSLALTITVSKYIYFQLGRATFMLSIEQCFDVNSVPTSTDETAKILSSKNIKVDVPARWFVKQRANRWLGGMMLFVTALLLIMIVFTIISPLIPQLNP
jgi:hypothetical protein